MYRCASNKQVTYQVSVTKEESSNRNWAADKKERGKN